MSNRKKLKDLTIRDNFMFAAVMIQEDICKKFLEMVLNLKIARVEISYEKSIIYNPEFKGVRLDVYAKDKENTRYDIEMQVIRENLGERTRYYHSQMDMELLLSGHSYDELPKAYVIFICDFDPFGLRKYCYTFESRCLEHLSLSLSDGCQSIFLSTKGENLAEISTEMAAFLTFIKEDSVRADLVAEDSFVRKIQEAIRSIKKNRDMEQRYMLLEDLLKDERKITEVKIRREAILELIEDFGPISEDVRSRIMSEGNAAVLKAMLKAAAKSQSLEQFTQLITNL